METVRLPRRLEDASACTEHNRRLREGTLAVDFREVEFAGDAALAALLQGITLDAIPDGLELEAIPEALSDQVEIMLRANAMATAKKPKKKKAVKGTAAAALWRAPSDAPPLVQRRSSAPPPSRRGTAPVLAVLAADIPSAEKIRAEVEERVLAELLGPAEGEDEELDEGRLRPRDRYLIGLMAPSRVRVRREELDTLDAAAADNSDDDGDDETGLSSDTMFPSSIGLTFSVEEGARLRIHARWGRYQRGPSATAVTETGKEKTVWKREAMGGTLADIAIVPGAFGPFSPDPDQPEVVVRGIANRMPNSAGTMVVSLFLVNGQDEPEDSRDEAWLFQPQLSVEGDPNTAPFVGRRLGGKANENGDVNDEDAGVAMLYRNRIEFSVGHGTSVACDISKDDLRRATRIRTRTVPRHEVTQQEARRPPEEGKTEGPAVDPALAGLELDMKELAECDDLRPRLLPLVAAYASWIAAQRARIGNPASRLEGHEAIAMTSLTRCEEALARLRSGIELVASDPVGKEAFRFANRAMWLQRVHTVWAERRRRGQPCPIEDVDIPANRSWRTFQLAFVLLTVEGLTRLDHPDRAEGPSALADLLWFPTGGGKTEAYLGCTAYTFAVRRLQGEIEGHSGEHGVAVLMRYTLRLLTLQQFQRAATLICACEKIRRDAEASGDRRWGAEPFRLGLWVGARTTPNKTEHADESLKLQKKASNPMGSAFAGSGSPVQLKNCPWCGTAVDPGRNMRVDSYGKGSGRTLVFCGDERGTCPFSPRLSPGEGIPVLVVDEEIYRRLPTLLISTVDKFAQMPWNPQVQMLFGRVNGKCSRHGFRSPETHDADSHPKSGALPPAKTTAHGPLRPPDLIIQDELHLISGPLGTLTGLYETAVDELCTWEVKGKRIRPKVIASTATVRRAREQMKALFARELSVFPPQGLDAEDNFFAIERSTVDVPGRVYVGICAPGRRLKAAIIRVYVAYLTAAQSVYQRYGKHADPWMTLVGYFSSLRELAGTRRVVDDDVRNRTFRIRRAGLASRSIGTTRELTSRLGATDIPQILDLLEVPFDPVADAKRKEERNRNPRPIDVLLATNMISVGVDVRRLGLMVCTGQPKTTAEYIQATSRVGRASPGLVCTIYNWARPRDLSHYESFEHYHATFYEHVEALSVTPFASRALDRGLSALLVSLIRQSGTVMNPNDAAALLDPTSDAVKHALDTIRRRAEVVEENNSVAAEVRRALEIRLQEWASRAKPKAGAARLGYRTAKDGQTEGLLKKTGVDPWETFTCLSSLRDVEPTVTLLMDDGRMDEAPTAAVETES